jgi:hypothetical protein
MTMRIFLLCLILLPLRAFGQDDPHPAATRETEASSTSRFRIIQSDLAVRITFRLDRYTGAVSQIVKDNSGSTAWQAMDILPRPSVKLPDHPRFQIFTSGMAVKFTFLLDNDTGTTWQLCQTTEKQADGSDLTVEGWQLVP